MKFQEQFKNLDLPFHGVRLAEFDIEEKYRSKLGLKDGTSNYDFLRALAWEGFKKKVKAEKGTDEFKTYTERAKYELDVISDAGFIDYVLLVWDVINYCRENGIATGYARGSAAGSLLLYLIDVTKIDPIPHELYFERFISKSRLKKNIVDGITYLDGSLLPDVDMDISYKDRGKVIDYIQKKHAGKTSKILTLNTLSGKLLIKECGKIVGGKSESEMNQVSDMVTKVFGVVQDIEKVYVHEKNFKEWCDNNREIYQIALKLRDLIKNKGAHASGYVISYEPVDEIIPLELSSDKELISGYDMNWMSKLTIKLDLLGLRSATLLNEVCNVIGIKPEDIDLNDSLIYNNLQHLETPHGIFQIEADCNFGVLNKVKPRNLEQLSAVVSLARPGALDFVDQYAKYINSEEFQSIHPFFDEVLKQTGGVCVYQEQLMKMIHKVGFTLDEAEQLRRVIGKKLLKEIPAWEAKIKEKIQENNLDPKIGEILWKIANDSSGYSFNKSHGFSYASLSAATTYLKFKYPKEFFLALFKLSKYEPDPINEISKIHKELHYFNIRLLPPSLAKSEMDFTIEGNDIRFGLSSIKGVSEKTLEKINQFRKPYGNKFDLFESAKQAKLSVGVLSALIQAGALDDFLGKRSKTVLEAQLWRLLTPKERTICFQLKDQFNFDLMMIIKHLSTTKNEKGKEYIKPSRYTTIKKHYEPYKEIYLKNSKCEDFANWWYEKTLLGFTYGKRLLDIFQEPNGKLEGLERIVSAEEDYRAEYVGTVSEVYEGTARNEKKTKYLKVIVEDEMGKICTMLFNEKISHHKENNEGLVKEGNIVVVRGRKKGDSIFADWINVQDHKIMMKLSELKEEKLENSD